MINIKDYSEAEQAYVVDTPVPGGCVERVELKCSGGEVNKKRKRKDHDDLDYCDYDYYY